MIVASADHHDDFVLLKGDLAVPLPALKLAWELEDKRVRLKVDVDDALVAGPKDRLTADDRLAIGRWARHLRAIARYQPPEVQ